MKIILAVTGASGISYALVLAKALQKHQLFIVVTDSAKKVMMHEEPDALSELKKCGAVFEEHAIDAPIASGSFKADAMIVCPCSMKTLAAIACGFSHNLVARAADVMIKERKPLVLVLREMPLSAIHLENALKLARLGVVIIPASPGFYHKPKKIEDLVNHVAGKVLDIIGLENELFKRWGSK
ncbi:UbiX family flavin prenyltransferase [Candidatus Micrarchaeota archaeon]|nr:UbiX family flavin prenyltransferase [Candidatus Micrarchaeota archaeon]